MSQRIVIECDECAELGEVGEAVTVEVRALGDEVEVDLCDVHRKPLVELMAHLVELGRKPGAVAFAANTCPRCGRKFGSPQALGKHARTKHGESANALAGRTSSTRTAAPVVDELVCSAPDCGREFGSRQGLAMHRFRTHGIRASEDAESSGG